MTDTTSPAAIMATLMEIEADLATRQQTFESAARKWFKAKRDKERDRAVAFLSAAGTVAERNATADQQTALNGVTEEAEYEAIKAVVRVLETRASIGQSLLRSQSRVESPVQPAWSRAA